MTKKERQYNKKLQELLDGVGKLQDGEVKKVLALLEQARTEIAARVAVTEWDAYHIPQLREAVDRAIETFRLRYMSEQNGALGNMWNAGIDMVDSPLQYVGFRLAAPEISRTALEIAQGYSADLVNGLSADALKQVNGQIISGVMGQKTSFQVMKEIGRSLDDKSTFASIAHRAEAITRTEMAKVNSMSREARAKGTVASNPYLPWKKKWISSGKARPRPNHAALNGVKVDLDQNFPGGIPYPHAPGLPAREVVNCG
jgi:hypothetical protein